jgi:glycosyltransferase involved in cell wall biosynthesis
MKTIVVMDSASRAGGGLFAAEQGLQLSLNLIGCDVAIFSLFDHATESDRLSWSPLRPRCFDVDWPSALGGSERMRSAIMDEPGDLIYRAGLWRLPSRYSHEWSYSKTKPEIIAPHGMLDSWAIRNSRWKKRLASFWFEARHLTDATCIRALCAAEADAIRAYGLKNPICIIPNGVHLPEERIWKQESNNRKKTLLFLGRIHPKKGLINALKAWKEIEARSSKAGGVTEWRFVIAGWDQGGHGAELKGLCDDLGITHETIDAETWVSRSDDSASKSSVIFLGPAFGETKSQLLRQSDAFILPSFSEGLPMAVLEAWSYGLPVVMTAHCNLPEGFAADAAIHIGTDVDMTVRGLNDLFAASTSERRAMGQRGRALVAERFSWPRVAAQMKEVYEWAVGGGSAPPCMEFR